MGAREDLEGLKARREGEVRGVWGRLGWWMRGVVWFLNEWRDGLRLFVGVFFEMS